MGNFCINCGKQLEDEQVCDCKNVNAMGNSSTQETLAATVQVQKNGFVEFLGEMCKLYADFLKKPATVIKLAIQKTAFKEGLFFVIIQAIIISIIALKSISAFRGYLGIFRFPINSLIGSDLEIFMKVSFLIIAQFFLLSGIFYCVGISLFKSTCSFKSIIAAQGIATIPFTTALIASIIIMYILPKIAIFFLFFGAILTFLLTIFGAKESLKLEEDKSLYFASISYVLYSIALVIASTLIA